MTALYATPLDSPELSIPPPVENKTTERQIQDFLDAEDCAGALIRCERALQDGEQGGYIYQLHANTLWGLARHEEALASIQKALDLGMNTPNTFLFLGQIFAALHRPQEANFAFRQVLSYDPHNLAWKLYIAHGWLSAGFPVYAAQYAQELLLEVPDSVDFHALLGYARLSLGDYVGGFSEYDWLRKLNSTPVYNPEKPQWCGETLNGETVLVYGESGLGDTLMYSRFVPEITARGGQVIFLVQAGLKRLIASIEGVTEVQESLELLPDYDFHVSLIHLPLFFSVRKETLFAPLSYLKPPPEALEKWRHIVEEIPGFRIGIGWRSAADSSRTFPLALLAQIAAIPGVTLVNVQKGEAADELRRANLPFEVVDLGSQVDDFADTAAVISHLDLLISADISVAHVAGAIGKPTLIVAKHGPDWRLCESSARSSWYPSWRIFKQPRMWDWSGVMEKVEEEVRQYLTSHAIATLPPSATVPDPLGEAQNAFDRCDPITAEKMLDAMDLSLSQSPGVIALRGRVYYAQGRKFEAEQTLIRAFDADQTNLALGKELATVCYDLGTFDLGITVLYRLLEIAPFDTEISRLLAMLQKAKRAVSKINIYSQILNKDAVVFDVGANIGQSCEAFLDVEAKQVTCCEPNPNCLSVLHQKFDNDSRVTLIPKGVGAEPGSLPFSVCDEISGISTFADHWKEGRFEGMNWNPPHLAEVTTLDALIEEYGVPDYIKIDVEGFETSVLEGLRRSVSALSFEFSREFPEATEACVDRLTALGFTEFNAVIGGWKRFLYTESVSADALLKQLCRHPDRSLVGDIFAFS